MSDEQTIRDALDRYYLPRTAAHAALDRLVARLRDAESVPFSGTVTRLLQRAEAAEKQRDEALDSVVLYVKERDEAVRLYGMEANERRSAEARANNLAPYVKRSQAAESRCATLEAALREIVGMPTTERNPDGEEQAAHSIKVVAADALAAASQPAEKEGTAFERSLLRADIKAGNADAAEAQLQRIKRLEAGTGQ